mgnify:CR=1 FL=1|tara:strand:+ start:82 stop:561 length:480 start_codon:yes stop_codon:yes gene_type:complete
MRIGHGFDAHQFGDGNHIIIGGVKIEHTHSIIAYSDGDVLVHAICDALIGAAGKGDIGHKFPDTDPNNKNIKSSSLLQQVLSDLADLGFQICNIDSTVITEAPRISPHIKKIKMKLAELLNLNADQINIKATTTEKMGYIGRGEGIAAHAVVLLKNKND